MPHMRCHCGWSIEVPSALARKPICCPVCAASIPLAPRVPYGYAPLSTWHPAPARRRVTAIRHQANVPARFALAGGMLALFLALFVAGEKGDKSVVCFSLLGMGCSIIGLHLSGVRAINGRGKLAAALGLLFAVLALMASPLPSGPCPGRLVRRDYVPATAPCPHERCPRLDPKPPLRQEVQPSGRQKFTPVPREDRKTAPPKAAPNPVDQELEEGF